jgi:outer membrane protein TolC
MRGHGVGLTLMLLLAFVGCTRDVYRRWADRDSYRVLAEHQAGAPWQVPPFNIVPPPESRLHDPTPPDFPPMPPDDPEAHQYMRRAGNKLGYRGWERDGVLEEVESEAWRWGLELDASGALRLTPEKAVELGILHSREYQLQLEALYLTALSLTLNRFEFDLQWFGTNATSYNHFGSGGADGGESNTLTNNTSLGFSRAFTTGGQLLVNLSNSFVWQFTGSNRETVSSGLAINFIQPLLRGAFRDVRMESLTQAERDVLYALRRFARFRKEFYLNVTTRGQGFLTLLLQVQSIRNLEANLAAQEQNLRLHEALYTAGMVSTVQVDQAFLGLQQARLGLLSARLSLDNALDAYKFQLGLPPSLPLMLDDSLLAPFQLNDPEFLVLQEQLEKLLAEFRGKDEAPSAEELKRGYERLLSEADRLPRLFAMVEAELQRWRAQALPADPDDAERERKSRDHLVVQVAELRQDQERLRDRIRAAAALVAPARRQADWDLLQKLARDEIALVSQLFVIQNQARVYLVNPKPFPFTTEQAIDIALANRLDLKNDLAAVTDAWRQIRVAADRLEAGLDVVVGANLATGAQPNGPFDFSSRANSYTVGLQFDAPLNRFAQRNTYRSSLVNYQRARRQWMASRDAVILSIRRGMRQLETDRLNFSIARQSLIAAARQVDAARERLLLSGANDSTGTLDILNALNSLLSAKNALISSWVACEVGRLQLLLDLELLDLDERGLYRDAAPLDPGPQRPVRRLEPGDYCF